jgi:hypothetical protein
VTKARILLFVLGAIGAIVETLRVALADGEILTLHTGLALAGAAVAGYAVKYRADLSPKQAEKALAAARADSASAARASFVPPPPPPPPRARHSYVADVELLEDVPTPRRKL